VKHINTDGMAFIGPGSEWFWTALSGVVLAVTFLAIYRQLALARSVGAQQQLAADTREWTSERMLRQRLDVMLALRDGRDPAHVPLAAASAVADYWDAVGSLARDGHLDRKVIDGANCQLWWATLAPFVRKVRVDWGDPQIGKAWERLAAEMAEMNRRDGHEIVDYAAMLAEKLDSRIAATQDGIRVEQALRTVILASPDPAAGMPSVPAAPPA
jgi:hypothetical protein